MADTLARASAQIIPMPGACTQPVVQRRGPGRHPRNIVSLRRAYVSREEKQRANITLPPAPNSVLDLQGQLGTVIAAMDVMYNGIRSLLHQKQALEIRLDRMQHPNGHVLTFETKSH